MSEQIKAELWPYRCWVVATALNSRSESEADTNRPGTQERKLKGILASTPVFAFP